MATEREDADDPYDLRAEPTLEALLRVLTRKIQLRIRTAAPGTVVKYNASTQKADIRLDHKVIVRDPKSSDGEAEAPTIILKNIPVFIYGSTSTGARISIPLQPGDTGQLIACDRSLETWMRNNGGEQDPFSYVFHSLADSVFYPGLHPNQNAFFPAPSTTAVEIDHTSIKLGATATEPTIKADTFAGIIDSIFAAATPVAMDGGASLKSTALAAWNAAKAAGLFKTTKTKAE